MWSFSASRNRQQGVVLLTALVFVLVTTLAASSLVTMYVTQMQREKEEQLLFAGDQIRRAIFSYYNTIPPGGARGLPQSLEGLVDDQRFSRPVHHLRRIYLDPITGQADWEILREQGGVIGVKSTSKKSPIKQKGFPAPYEAFETRESYSDWTFTIR